MSSLSKGILYSNISIHGLRGTWFLQIGHKESLVPEKSSFIAAQVERCTWQRALLAASRVAERWQDLLSWKNHCIVSAKSQEATFIDKRELGSTFWGMVCWYDQFLPFWTDSEDIHFFNKGSYIGPHASLLPIDGARDWMRIFHMHVSKRLNPCTVALIWNLKITFYWVWGHTRHLAVF